MDGFDKIQDIWLEQPLENAPRVEDVYAAMKKYKRKTARNYYIEMVGLSAGFCAMVYLFVWVPSVTTTTRIGILFVIWTILYGGYIKAMSFRNNRQVSVFNVNDYITHLEVEKIQTCTGTANEQARAFLLLCTGYAFYIYGWLSGNIIAMIIVYAIMTLMFGLIWFVLRPYSTQKRRKKIQSLIIKLETIKKDDL